MSFIVKNTTFPNPLDLLAPHSCRGCGLIGKPICDRCKKYIMLEHQNFCPNCKTLNPTGNCQKCTSLPSTFVIADRSTIIGNLIHDFKYSSISALAQPIAELTDYILPEIPGKVSIVPLPTISRHIRERGFDHTYKIAKNLLTLRTNWKIEPILLRVKNTVQVGATETERKSQVKKAYTVNPKTTIDKSTTYILLDDVWTTGASMKAALKKISSAGAEKIILVVLAVSQMRN